MKFLKLTLAIVTLCMSFNSAMAFDWETLKKKISSTVGGDASTVVDNILKTDNLDVKDLEGAWKSAGPSVSFKSENILEKAGGVAAATAIENKLTPYYQKAGLENAIFTFSQKGELTITLKNGRTITGTVEKGVTEGTMVFTFGKLKNLGKITAYVSKGTSLSIMFDASKLVKLVTAIADYSKNANLTSISTMLKSYDGVYAGFKFNKQ